MKKYNKLVRDKIPEIMLASGAKPVTKILDDKEYTLYLEKKLDEEVAEYHRDKNLEELADILEVVYALCENSGHSVDELSSVYSKKHNARGGFAKRIFLVCDEQ
jgi:predicted house-cleaning noncanonical NTP pyrophosphatase (MazG superfamily)